jgi:hypothetical protein
MPLRELRYFQAQGLQLQSHCSARSRLGFARQRVRSHLDLLRVREEGGRKSVRVGVGMLHTFCTVTGWWDRRGTQGCRYETKLDERIEMKRVLSKAGTVGPLVMQAK